MDFINYFFAAVAHTCAQLLVVFGAVFLFAIALYFISREIRGLVTSKIGMIYYYIVSPGVACHETGHALGCILTGAKIVEYVPFRPQADCLGYVNYEWRWGFPLWWHIANVIISTGPIWFGSIVIFGLTMLFPDNNVIIVLQDAYSKSFQLAGIKYFFNIFLASFKLFKNLLFVWRWTSPWFILYFYGIYCIASEMQLSDVDLNGMWKGIVLIFLVFLVANLIPFASYWINYAVAAARPFLFFIQVILALALILDLFFLVFLYILTKIFGRKKYEG